MDVIAERIAKGDVGTYALMTEPGYLKAATSLLLEQLTTLEIAEKPNHYQAPLTSQEHKLLTDYRALQAEDKHRLHLIAESFKKDTA